MVAHHVVSILVWPIAALNGVAGPFLLHFLSRGRARRVIERDADAGGPDVFRRESSPLRIEERPSQVHGAIVAVPAVAVVRAVPLRPRLGRRRRRVRRFRARVLYSSVVERARRAPRGARRADVLRGDAPRRARVRPVARPRGYVCSTRARASSSFVRPVRETPRAPARGRREAASGVVACSSRPRDAAAPPRSLAFRARLGRSGRAGISAPPRRACPRF
mmetsp:Transcript_24275/g.74836  ORF Transcript_24275/g.74836 Transcript_24275/m.74836 type:complete len:220 (+) Transcript_24275:735-1394(+)